ncbi:MAG: M23 family metallopeptidase [Tannerellaceae bacterium]|jgi:lipoprotein NlpD|nr:M23 family metallopeptidase [Tannerellaceae bacterium]
MPGKLFDKAFWRSFKFKYKISITNENTLEEMGGLYISKLNGLSILVIVFLILFAIAASILTFTPLRNYLPGYMNSEVRAQIVYNALRVDSLMGVIERQNLYVMNIQDIFKGVIQLDTVSSMANLTEIREDSLMERTEREAEFRRQYEEAEKYNLTTINIQAEVGGLIFHTPTRGIVSSHFDVDSKHLGIDIAASPNESVLATLDGTVIFSGYTAEVGYVIAIQHSQEFISVYKHCAALLKQEGNLVKGGDVIAVVGNTGTLTTGPHLHFELWHKGRPVDPVNYILF